MKRICKVIVITCVVFGTLYPFRKDASELASYLGSMIFDRNFHEVVPGQLYRSAEMSRDEISRTVRTHRIKTVVDLRLQDDYSDPSGRTEARATAEAGGIYIHIPLSGSSANQLPQLMRLLKTFDEAERPVLVHCSSGTHRTGVASAIWMLDKGNSAFRAREQLGLRYGFLDIERKLKAFINGRPSLDFVLRAYFAAEARGGCSFREWLEHSAKMDHMSQWKCPPPSH